MEELKMEALKTYLNQYRCITNIELILDSIGITIERSFNNPENKNTLDSPYVAAGVLVGNKVNADAVWE